MKIASIFGPVLAAVLLCTGCESIDVRSGRQLLLKEYSPNAAHPGASPLQGVQVCVKPFRSEFRISDDLKTVMTGEKPQDPPGYLFRHMTPEEKTTYNKECQPLNKKKRDQLPKIGILRNGFGNVLSYVYALNDPGLWLSDTLKADLKQQGALVVDTEFSNPAITVNGVLRYLKEDGYGVFWADMIVDLEIQVPGRPPITRTIHVNASEPLWTVTRLAALQPFRQCQQKFSLWTMAELEKSLATKP